MQSTRRVLSSKRLPTQGTLRFVSYAEASLPATTRDANIISSSSRRAFSSVGRSFTPALSVPCLHFPKARTAYDLFKSRENVREYSTQPQQSTTVNVSEKDFSAKVMEASQNGPVILDCYADWCAPCKKLTPLLEKECQRLGITLAKLNVDQNPNITRKLNVASLPTVFAIYKGQLIDNFVGMLPDKDFKRWFDNIIDAKKAIDGEHAEVGQEEQAMGLIEEAKALLAEGKVPEASQKYGEVLNMKAGPAEPLALAGLALCALEENNLEAAQSVVKALKDGHPKSLHLPDVARAISTVELRVEFAKGQGGDAGTGDIKNKLEEYKQKLKENPNDHQTRYDLAFSLFSIGQTEAAIDEVLDLIKREKYWNEEAARKLLLKIFDSLGPNSDLTKKTRARFASVWFC